MNKGREKVLPVPSNCESTRAKKDSTDSTSMAFRLSISIWISSAFSNLKASTTSTALGPVMELKSSTRMRVPSTTSCAETEKADAINSITPPMNTPNRDFIRIIDS